MTKKDSTELTTIWGIPVSSINGRRAWPEAIKLRAIERVRSGDTVVSVSKEIGANESVLHRWLSQSKAVPTPAFVEVSSAIASVTSPSGAAPEAVDACVVRLGDISITIRPGYPLDHLQLLLRAVRGSL